MPGTLRRSKAGNAGVWYGRWSEKNQRQRCCSLFMKFRQISRINKVGNIWAISCHSSTWLAHITSSSSSQDLNFYYPCHPCPVQSQKHAELSCLSQERPQGFRLPHQCARRRGTGPSPLKAKSSIIQLLNIDGILLKGTQQKELESSIRAFVPKSWLSTILTSAITGPMLLPWQQMMWRNRTVKTSSIEVPEYQECIEMLPCIIGVSMNFCQWNRSAQVFFYFSS